MLLLDIRVMPAVFIILVEQTTGSLKQRELNTGILMKSPPISAKVLSIIDRLNAAGAEECLIVGGWVRDYLMNRSSKDYDIEVYGLSYPQIVSALEGLTVNLVGKTFGVVKIGAHIDVSIPRRENKQGLGHRGFKVEPDPEMTFREAALRRDFTINSIAIDRRGNIIDPHQGQRDIDAGLLRATSPAFKEDPLRVLRGMQFASRLGFVMEPETVRMCREVSHEFATLSSERIYDEWRKWATGDFPAMGLVVLESTGWLSHFPHLKSMVDVPQDPIWHPEGDVWQHTKYVCDAAAQIAGRRNFAEEQRQILLLAALLHDCGKPATTHRNEEGRWVSPSHAEAGGPISHRFLSAVQAPQWLTDAIIPLVLEHMIHLSFPADIAPPERVVRRLADRLAPATIGLWAALCEADHSGRPPNPAANPVEAWEQVAEQLAIKDARPKPLLKGRHLLDLGIQPGPDMGKLLARAFEAQLDGVFATLEEAIAWVKEQG